MLGKLYLFDDHIIPALGMDSNENEMDSEDDEKVNDKPVLYLGGY